MVVKLDVMTVVSMQFRVNVKKTKSPTGWMGDRRRRSFDDSVQTALKELSVCKRRTI